MLLKKTPDESCRSTEENEDTGKSGDEKERMDYDLPADLMGGVFGLQVGERESGYIGDIRRNQGQTQGERNERSPAINAPMMVMLLGPMMHSVQ